MSMQDLSKQLIKIAEDIKKLDILDSENPDQEVTLSLPWDGEGYYGLVSVRFPDGQVFKVNGDTLWGSDWRATHKFKKLVTNGIQSIYFTALRLEEFRKKVDESYDLDSRLKNDRAKILAEAESVNQAIRSLRIPARIVPPEIEKQRHLKSYWIDAWNAKHGAERDNLDREYETLKKRLGQISTIAHRWNVSLPETAKPQYYRTDDFLEEAQRRFDEAYKIQQEEKGKWKEELRKKKYEEKELRRQGIDPDTYEKNWKQFVNTKSDVDDQDDNNNPFSKLKGLR